MISLFSHESNSRIANVQSIYQSIKNLNQSNPISCLSGIQSAQISLQQDVSHVFSMNSWSNWAPNDSFGICLSWRLWNTPYMFNLMKNWLSYLRLKTIDSISIVDCSSITATARIHEENMETYCCKLNRADCIDLSDLLLYQISWALQV